MYVPSAVVQYMAYKAAGLLPAGLVPLTKMLSCCSRILGRLSWVPDQMHCWQQRC